MIAITQGQLDAFVAKIAELASRLAQSLGGLPQPPPSPVQSCAAPPVQLAQTEAAVAHTAQKAGVLGKYQPTGMANGGVAESQRRAAADLAEAKKYKETFEKVGAKYGVDPAIVAGIASRESNMGRLLDAKGEGDRGNGYGLMQVDKQFDRNGVATRTLKGTPTSAEHIEQAVDILVKEKLGPVKRVHPEWSEEKQMQRAIALYNGASSPYDGVDMDRGTTGGDYSNDVWARSQYFAENW